MSVVRFALASTVLLLVACEAARPPLSRAQVIGCSDSLLLREYLVWGSPIEVLPPAGIEADGRRWWQVRYPSGGDGSDRIILVDEDSRWARIAPEGYVPRVPAIGSTRSVTTRLDAGPWVLVVLGSERRPAEERAEVEVDVAELNRLASRTGLQPAFSTYAWPNGELTIVWGWQGEHGTQQDPRVRDWLDLRTRYRDSRWVDLTQ